LEGYRKPLRLKDGELERQAQLLLALRKTNSAAMASVSFGDAYTNVLVGNINAPVKPEFHHNAPPGELQRVQADWH
jgi:hypothetical protein